MKNVLACSSKRDDHLIFLLSDTLEKHGYNVRRGDGIRCPFDYLICDKPTLESHEERNINISLIKLYANQKRQQRSIANLKMLVSLCAFLLFSLLLLYFLDLLTKEAITLSALSCLFGAFAAGLRYIYNKQIVIKDIRNDKPK